MSALLVPLVVIALFSFIFIRSQQGEGATLAARQQQSRPISPSSVDKVVRTAPDPIGRETATGARCTPLGGGALLDPWRCVLRYPTGRVIQYQVNIRADGSFVGDNMFLVAPPPQRRFGGTINGCCIAVP